MPLVTLLAALGAVQGLLLCVLIVVRFRTAANLPLALLLFAFSLRVGTIPTWNAAAILEHSWLLPVTTTLPFLFGPLLWWYTREVAEGSRPRFVWVHLLPYSLGLVITALGVVLRSPAAHAELVESIFAGAPPARMVALNAVKVLLNAVYVVLAARIAFGRASRRIPPVRTRWTRVLVVASALSLAPYALVAIDSGRTAALADGAVGPFLLVAAAMALLVYSTTVALIVTPELPGCIDEPNGSASHIPESECRRIAELVRDELAGGAYRDPQLSLTALARSIGVHPNSLSAAVNHVYGASFRRIVNHHRVEHFRNVASSSDDRNILDLALDAGFPSKSTFNRVFKEETGLTPSQYLSSIPGRIEKA